MLEELQMDLITNIKSLLVPTKELKKKQVGLWLPIPKIRELNDMVELLRPYSDGKVNRNALLEIAIQNLIERLETKEYFDMLVTALNLSDIKQQLDENQELALHTHNKKTGWIGVASFFANNEDMICVYEGSPDGSDDKDISFEDFILNYDYYLGHETEDVSERWKKK